MIVCTVPAIVRAPVGMNNPQVLIFRIANTVRPSPSADRDGMVPGVRP